jgi:protein-tyrosine phosphatase
MIDIHSHFLPGIDDGPKGMDTAVAMVKMAAEDGITHLVATPHCNASYTFSPERNSDLLDELRVRTGGRITLLSGCDFHLSYENIQQVLTDKTPFTLNQGDYLLAEFSQYGIAPQALDVFHKLRLADIVPIITHPERNPLLQGRGYDYLQKLVEMGCPVQVTAASITGGFGGRAKEFSEHLLARGSLRRGPSWRGNSEPQWPRHSW